MHHCATTKYLFTHDSWFVVLLIQDMWTRCDKGHIDHCAESTKCWDPGIQNPEEGFKCEEGLRAKGLMGQNQGLLKLSQKQMIQYQSCIGQLQKLMIHV